MHPPSDDQVPNEPGLSPNNGLENAFLSDQSMASNPHKGQAKRFGAKTTSHDGKAGHIMTHVCHCARQERHKTKNVRWKHPGTPDLMPRWMRPYKVLESDGHVAYLLDLPASEKMHPMCHVSLLQP